MKEQRYDIVTDGLRLTQHARVRMGQRGITREAIRFALQHGKCLNRLNKAYYYVRDKDVEAARSRGFSVPHCRGLTVIIADNMVITAYKDRKSGLRKVKRKPRQLYGHGVRFAC